MFSLKKTVIVMVVLAGSFTSARAMSVRDFEALPQAAQSEYLVSFLEKMTYQIGQQKPELAARIKDYYVRQQPGKAAPDGIEQISVELAVLDSLSQKGQADLTKLQIEGVVVGVTKRQFPPQVAER